MHTILKRIILIASLLLVASPVLAMGVKAKVIGVEDQVVRLSLYTAPAWKKNKTVYLFDDEDILKARIKKIKSKQLWIKVMVSSEDILWEKGDSVMVSTKKPKYASSPLDGGMKKKYVLNYHAGYVTGSNNVLLQDAKNVYQAKTSSGAMLSLSIDKRYSRKHYFFSIGLVMQMGQLSYKTSYEQGDIKLTYQAFLTGLNLNIGYDFDKKWYGILGLQHFQPIHHQVTIDAPTGSIKHSPDSSFEFRTHATVLAIGYRLSPGVGLELGASIKPLVHGGLQGRGFTAITLGGFYAL